MTVIEITIKIFLLNDLKQEHALSAIASYIDQVMLRNPDWEILHNENRYKYYTFSSLSPVEPNGVYRKENIYTFRIRTVNRELAQYLAEVLPNWNNALLKGLLSKLRIIPKQHITEVYSLTPVIVKGIDNHYWRDDLTFADFEKRLTVNLIKKYNSFLDTKINENFQLYTLIEITNRIPIGVPYKNIKLLADKIKIVASDNPMAQEIIYMALGTGICELNARGFGFLNYHYI